MAQHVRVARDRGPVASVATVGLGEHRGNPCVGGVEHLLPRRVRHRRSALGQPQPQWLQPAVVAFDQQPHPFRWTDRVDRDGIGTSTLVPPGQPARRTQAHLRDDQTARHALVAAVPLRCPDGKPPSGRGVGGHPGKGSGGDVEHPLAALRDRRRHGPLVVAVSGHRLGDFQREQATALAQPQTAAEHHVGEASVAGVVAAPPRFVGFWSAS